MKHTPTVALGASIALLTSSAFAAAPAYKADQSFGANEMKGRPICLSIDAKDQIHVLLDNGTVMLYNTDGKSISSFKSDMNPAPTTMTVDDGKIYLFNSSRAEKTIEYRGKKLKRLVSNGIGCNVYDAAGTKTSELKLPEAMSAADAHFIGKELAVGDLEKSQIVYYQLNGTEGKVTRKIQGGFRLCCGIFDFCPGTTPESIIVANLGAFKVQTYIQGKMSVEFGQRGAKPDEFHGCCNPVNVGTLKDGAVITVEKSPTRVKIFDKDGKTSSKVTGLTELVEGCSTIPIAVDSKGAIYLASDTKKCVVKCVPGVSDKPEPAEPKEEAAPAEPATSAGMKEVIQKVMPLMQSKEFDKALTEARAIMKAHPEMADNEKAQIELGLSLSPHMEKGDADAALKQIDSIVTAYPKSDIAKHPDELKKSIKEYIQSMKGAKAKGGDEESSDDEDESPEVLEK